MDLKVLSDDGDVLRLEVVGRVVRSDGVQALQPFDDVLGPGVCARNVLLSLAETTFIDTRCLGWLLTIHRRFCQEGGRLVVHSIRPQVTAILELLRFEFILNIAEDETAALERLRAEDS